MQQLADQAWNNTAETTEIGHAVMREIFRTRRMLPGESEKAEQFAEEAAPHLPNIMAAIAKGEPIHLVLPAFPAKSPNRAKTLGPVPDLGEDIAFKNLNDMCERISRVYDGGAKLTVCSDGRVFADVVHIPDDDVTTYNQELRARFGERYQGTIGFFDLDDVYPSMPDYVTLREELMVNYAEPLQSLRQRCKSEAEAGEMYKGITRFLVEDYSGLPEFQGQAKNAIQNYARKAAYRVIQRSNAWSRLVADHLPGVIRLSIHPQFRVSAKIGVNLVGAEDVWTTPWHSVVLKVGDKSTLVPRSEAERRNAMLIFENGRPFFYQQREAVAS